jgi:MoaA/NifB/PqqE/SkfB family radical SAM enzyme
MDNIETTDFILKGILDGSRAFTGPSIVQFDLTNRCNSNCLCCWNNSPLLGELSNEKKRERQYELPLDLIKKTIVELKEMGTKNLFFAGGGEPFVHPDIMEVLECAKQNNMKVFINTNFTCLDEEKVEKIVDLKVDLIHVSLLAGNSKTYVSVHPNKSESDFYRIKKLLEY